MNKNFYKNLIQNSPIGYVYFKKVSWNEGVPYDFEFIDMNNSFEVFIETDKEKFINSSYNYIKKESVEKDLVSIFEKIKTNKEEFEHYSKKLNSWFKVFVYNEDDKHSYLNIIDISEKKKKEIELKKSEEKYKKILETSREIVLILQDDKIVFFNKSLEKVTSYEKHELLGMEINNLIYKDELDIALKNYNKRISKDFIHPYQFKMHGKDDKIIWLEISASEIEWKGKTSVLCFLSDVTQRRNYEIALHDSEKRKTSLIQSMDDFIYVLDSDFVFKEFFVPNSEKSVINEKDLLGKSLFEVDFLKTAFNTLRDTFLKVLQTGETAQAEYYIKLPTGVQWHDIRVSPISESNHLKTELLCVARNITKLKETEKEIRLERDLFSEGPVITISCDYIKNWKIKKISSNVENILGHNPNEIMDSEEGYFSFVHRDDIENIVCEVDKNIKESKDSFEHSYRVKNSKGEYKWFYDFTRIIRDIDGNISEIRGYLFDQSQIRDMEYQLKNERERLANIIEGTNAGTWEWNIQTNETRYNRKWAEILGYSFEEIRTESLELHKHIHPDDYKKNLKYMEKHFSGENEYHEFEYRVKHKNGKWIWVHSRGKVMSWTEEGKPLLMFGIHLDVNKKRLAEEKIKELSARDPLTNIYNRRAIFEKLKEIERNSKKLNTDYSVCIIDIDYFKHINDNHGHMAGDYILKEFTKLIKNHINISDLFGRYGGEEFILIFNNCKKEYALEKLNFMLERLINTNFKFKNEMINFTFSAGIADNSEFNIKSVDQLIDIADKNLYRAKKLGRNRIEF